MNVFFHKMHRHLIADLLWVRLKLDMGLVPPWQQQDHSSRQLFVNKQNAFKWRPDSYKKLILKSYGAYFLQKLGEKNTEQFLKQVRDTGLAKRKAGSGQPRTARTDENINLFDELVLSQEDAPQPYDILIYLRHMPVVCTNYYWY